MTIDVASIVLCHLSIDYCNPKIENVGFSVSGSDLSLESPQISRGILVGPKHNFGFPIKFYYVAKVAELLVIIGREKYGVLLK